MGEGIQGCQQGRGECSRLQRLNIVPSPISALLGQLCRLTKSWDRLWWLAMISSGRLQVSARRELGDGGAASVSVLRSSQTLPRAGRCCRYVAIAMGQTDMWGSLGCETEEATNQEEQGCVTNRITCPNSIHGWIGRSYRSL